MPTVYPKDFFLQTSKKFKRASCFVIMPFDPKFREVYDILKETLESDELNIECNRADDFHQAHIIETILKGIAHSEYIIADLTGSNPNVFYELGLVHCTKEISKVVILTQDMNFVPFDLRQFRCVVYEQSINGSKRLKEELVKTFKEAARNTFRFKVRENGIIPFDKRLVGDENFLYELEFEFPFIGEDAIKMQIHFSQLSVDKSKKKLESQYLFLSENKPSEKVKNIPWYVTLVRTNGKEAIISMDKDN